MIKSINLAEKEKAIKYIDAFKTSVKSIRDIEIINSHIFDLNAKIGEKVFANNVLYMNSSTIHDLMQPLGGVGQHNYHNLTADEIYMALSSIKDPRFIYSLKNKKRYALITVELSHFNYPLMVVIETKAGLMTNMNANINKVVTIYPKSYIDEYIEKLDKRKLLYKKQ